MYYFKILKIILGENYPLSILAKKVYFCKIKTSFSDEKTDRLWQEINFIKKLEPLYKTDKNEEIEWVK